MNATLFYVISLPQCISVVEDGLCIGFSLVLVYGFNLICCSAKAPHLLRHLIGGGKCKQADLIISFGSGFVYFLLLVGNCLHDPLPGC